MTFSVGLAPTKVLAKVASKTQKPAGFTVITKENIRAFLEPVQVGKVWGIGPSTSAAMMGQGIRSALDFALKPEWWVLENLAKPYQEIWYELNGTPIHRVSTNHQDQKSVMKTRTFRPTKDRAYVLSELSKNVENACLKLRDQGLVGKEFTFFLKTQQFLYYRSSLKLFRRSAVPTDYLLEILKTFSKIFRPGMEYRATGVVIHDIKRSDTEQHDLFGISRNNQENMKLFKVLDFLNNKFKRGSVFLAGSLRARTKNKDIRDTSERLSIPFWGEAI
jgi:nucleotidyltransferase/DNA polymerase involved in DNA repair